MRIDVHVHFHPDESKEQLSLVLNKISSLQTKMETMMATLDEVLADVQAESTQIDSLTTLTAGLKQQLTDALSGVTLPPDVQAKVDAVFAGVEANKQKVVNANT
jgi:capsule polysaccharide export protein KpsE/RkpR